MLSIPDMALLGAAALLLFGPEQLPRVARKAGHVMREIQNTSQSFIREMERAADLQDEAAAKSKGPAYDPAPYGANAYDAEAPTMEFSAVGEHLADPRPAPGLEPAEPDPVPPPASASEAAPHAPGSAPAQPAPQADHSAHL